MKAAQRGNSNNIPTVADVLAARRELANRSLLDFCGSIEIPGAPVEDDTDDDESLLYHPIRQPPAAHHRILIEKLEAVERGECRRLMIFMPPGSAKSTYASVVFPVWYMGKRKRRNVIVATYASDLARKIGRRARSIVRQPAYENIFGVGMSADSSAADEWALTNENEFMGGGILSGITGNRASGIIIDDPVKGRQEADSPIIQQRTREEYQDSIKTRLIPGGWIVLIQTRWNQADLAGSILPENYDGESGQILCRDGEMWEVLCIPAQANRADDPLGRKVGEYLWPEWFTEQHWASFRSNPRTWSALYQQRPQPDEGTFFKKEWLQSYDFPPKVRIFGASDYAVTEGGGDFTEHGVFGVDALGDIYVLDWWWGQETPDVWIERQLDLASQWKPFAWFGESGTIRRSIEPFLIRRARERKVFVRFEWIASVTDKPTRARGFQARAAMKKVHIPNTSWGQRLVDQLLRFPAGAHDDAVDVCSLFGMALDMAHPATAAVLIPDGPIKGLESMTMDQAFKLGVPQAQRQDRI